MQTGTGKHQKVLMLAVGGLCFWLAGLATRNATGEPTENRKADEPAPSVSIAEARERAKLMHEIYAATLETLHHHYFRKDRSVLPARAMEDVFDEMNRQSKIQARWISVNTKAMSIHHEPKSEFEKQAARAIADGKETFERIDDGYYHRARAIPLGSGCVSCHTGFFSRTPQTQRFAGLVISVPIGKK